VIFQGQMDAQIIRTPFVFQITAVVAISTGTLITKLLIVKMMNELKTTSNFINFDRI
jgi:hypothetical protein